MSREQDFDQAAQKADRARQAFMASVNDARWRFAPAQLKAEARQKAGEVAQDVRDHALQSARSHPFIVGGSLVALTGWLFRRPIAALSRLLYVKMRDMNTEEER